MNTLTVNNKKEDETEHRCHADRGAIHTTYSFRLQRACFVVGQRKIIHHFVSDSPLALGQLVKFAWQPTRAVLGRPLLLR